MGKKGRRHGQGNQKKAKNKREPENKSEDTAVQVEGTKKCVHVLKAAKLGVLQNNIPHTKLGECSYCESSQDNVAGVCICLCCGKQVCDRYSEDKHGLSHYKGSPSHCLTAHLHSMIVWCYTCDTEVPVVPNSDLHECIKLLIKVMKLNAPNDQVHVTPNIAVVDPTVQKSEIKHLKFTSNSNSRIKGLVNLGNTCFFNAVMQNLCQTELVHVAMAFVNQTEYSQMIFTKNELPEIPVQVTTPAGSLITALNKLLCDFRSSSPGPLSPKFLFSEICKKAPRFRGFQQQDSQELLRYLLDSVKTEQQRRVKIGLLKVFEIDEGTEVKNLPENKKQKIKEYVSHVTAPSVDSVFAGKLDSIVVCRVCHKESRVTESFLDLSLSLVTPQSLREKQKSNKDANVPLRNKNKNNAHSHNQKNAEVEADLTKVQTPSKHQQKKAAREAKKKKGKRGKRRSVSHSASEDDKLEGKQSQEAKEGASDESEHEDHGVSNDSEIDSEVMKNTTVDLNNSLMGSNAGDDISDVSGRGEKDDSSNESSKVVIDEVVVHQDVTISGINDVGQQSGLEDSLNKKEIEKNSGMEDVTKDSGMADIGTKNCGVKDVVIKHSEMVDIATNDSGNKEVVTKDSGMEDLTQDSGMEDLTKDSGMEDVTKYYGMEDIVTKHSEIADIATNDSGNKEVVTKDSGMEDVTQQDSGMEDLTKDSEIEDAITKNSGMEDVVTKDSGIVDVVTKDSGIEDVATKDSGMEDVIIKDSGMEDGTTKNSGMEDGKRDSKKECTKDSGMENVVTKDSGIEDVTKGSGMVDVTQDSGIEDVTKGSRMVDVVTKDSSKEEVQNVDDFVLEEDTAKFSRNEENTELSDESKDSKEQEETDSINSSRVLDHKSSPSSPTHKKMSSSRTNSDFLHFDEKEVAENDEKYLFPGAVSEGEDDFRTESPQNLGRIPAHYSHNVSFNKTFGNDSKNMPNNMHIDDKELSENILKKCEISSEDALEMSRKNEQNKLENLNEENTEIVDLFSQTNQVKTQVLGGEQITESSKETYGKKNNTVEGILADDNDCQNSCENCKKADNNCEFKSKDCGSLKNDEGSTKQIMDCNSFCEDNRKDSSAVTSGIKKLEITDDIAATSIEDDNDNMENKNSNIKLESENSIIIDDQQAALNVAEEKIALNEGDSFSPTVLTLGPRYVSRSHEECSVESCLSLFCSPEILEGKNKFACEECSKRKKENRDEEEDDKEDNYSDEGATASKPKTKQGKEAPIVYTEATKQMLLSSTPPVLTLHFKRFQQVGFGLRKVPKHVDFPLVLDLAPFCRRNGEIYCDSKQQVLYSLIGVVEHSGGLNSGHYTACVKLKSTPTYGHLTDLSTIKDFSSFIEGMWRKSQGKAYSHVKPRDGQWYHVSDSRVSSVTEARVLKSQAYMLFYERLPFEIDSNFDY